MQAQRKTVDLVREINRLYLALGKTNHSPAETATTINSILLNEGFTKQELSQAWDKWYAMHGGKEKEQCHDD